MLGVESSKLTIPGRAFRRRRGAARSRRSRAARSRQARRRLDQGEGYRITDLGVHVDGGSVLLTGRARSEDAAYAAVEAASSVSGVQEVVNALTYPTLAHGS